MFSAPRGEITQYTSEIRHPLDEKHAANIMATLRILSSASNTPPRPDSPPFLSLYLARFLQLPESYWAAISAIIVMYSDISRTMESFRISSCRHRYWGERRVVYSPPCSGRIPLGIRRGRSSYGVRVRRIRICGGCPAGWRRRGHRHGSGSSGRPLGHGPVTGFWKSPSESWSPSW